MLWMWSSLSWGSPASGDSWKMDTGASMFCHNNWCAIKMAHQLPGNYRWLYLILLQPWPMSSQVKHPTLVAFFTTKFGGFMKKLCVIIRLIVLLESVSYKNMGLAYSNVSNTKYDDCYHGYQNQCPWVPQLLLFPPVQQNFALRIIWVDVYECSAHCPEIWNRYNLFQIEWIKKDDIDYIANKLAAIFTTVNDKWHCMHLHFCWQVARWGSTWSDVMGCLISCNKATLPNFVPVVKKKISSFGMWTIHTSRMPKLVVPPPQKKKKNTYIYI